ncbi:MAG: solute carrier family 23 protein [Aminobacterium sp.]|jgi:uracil-xanthine permease|uniref:uracil-xanthine permease family protein n=1 Tax=unclassified Aminobacterium TaxID=2685012 RepID=UPI001BCC5371|nr:MULTISPECIES: solute carrier family 23 protein [unclassified Aminobacterium]MDD2207635.1 solute carrier family 23 protein [Aminobacterium sp.]MDD3426581.1 solute carrier family 23 protein [Aminobacterium sp.]MDD3708380.1 solute carrier family 23 protein [Aminobacterium sp.]MDD4229636.1 solute carrier family 23 protein [Aminobacterium sp.]MDD4551603.1 solute carrier family 23 protein [Aminobacterium sp.]
MAIKNLIYGVDDKPPFPIMVLAGFQHVLTLFGATTLVPLIFGPAMGMTTAEIGFFISCVYLAMGIATLIQTHPKLGSGLPIVQGSSFSFIPPIMTIIAAYGASGPSVVMQHVGGALIAGGLILSVIGYSRIVGIIRKVITPVVIGPTIMAIGFSLAPVAIQFNAANYWPISLIVVFCVFFFSLMSKNKYFNIFAILASITIAYLVALAGSLSGFFPADHPAFINLASVVEAPWFRFTGFMPWGVPKFDLVSFGAIIAGFFAVMIESIGDYHSCSYVAGLPDPEPSTINRGIGAEGLNCAIAGTLGAVATTSYTENIGLIGLTGVASRWVVRTGAVLLIIMSFIGKIGALIATIPSPVIGGAYIALFGIIGTLGIQVLLRADMTSQRNVLIVGFAFLMALGLPGWVEAQKDAFFALGIGGQVLWAVMKTPMAVAGICAAFWDSIVPGTNKERGITD